jgi:ubiquinone/menaquinone biosynthesis C-methylase UbiE
MKKSSDEWSDPNHSINYLGRVNSFPYRKEGDAILLANISADAARILDIGSGDGRLIKMIKENSRKSDIEFVALDISPTMLKSLKHNFANDTFVKVIEHDLDTLLPDLGYFDAIISGFAIHHLRHSRKYSLYEEIYDMLNPTGVFCNLEHVSSISTRQQMNFLSSTGMLPCQEDKTNRLLSVEKQLRMLRDIGFIEVDCLWKWYELALLIAFKN